MPYAVVSALSVAREHNAHTFGSVVMMPSPEEMGGIVHLLNKGAVEGLQDVGLLPPGRLSFAEDDVAAAFVTLYDFVFTSFDSQELDKMTYDPIMLEHALCKFKRLQIGRRGIYWS